MLKNEMFSPYGYKEYQKLYKTLPDQESKDQFDTALEDDFKKYCSDIDKQFLNIGDVDRAHRLITRLDLNEN